MSTSGASEKEEASEWSFNWWDLLPLCDSNNGAMAFTSSSNMLTPHPLSTTLVSTPLPTTNKKGKSPKSISLPYPLALASLTANVFGPATIIEVSPRDELVFAYFPSLPTPAASTVSAATLYEGVGVFYARSPSGGTGTGTEWEVVNPPIYFDPGDGAVTAQWLMQDREWINTSPLTRLPFKGPQLPNDTAALLVVTQIGFVRLYAKPAFSPATATTSTSTTGPGYYTLSGNIVQPSLTSLPHPSYPGPSSSRPTPSLMRTPLAVPPPSYHSTFVVIKAAIGQNYDDDNILISCVGKWASSGDEDGEANTKPDLLEPEWEDTVEEQGTIHTCLLKLGHEGWNTTMKTVPVTPLSGMAIAGPRATCTHLHFIPTLTSPTDVTSQPPTQLSTASDALAQRMKPIYLVASFINFNEYASPPISTIALWRLQKTPTPSDIPAQFQQLPGAQTTVEPIHISTRTFTEEEGGIVIGLAHTAEPELGLMVARIKMHGQTKKKEGIVDIGKFGVLSLQDLSDDARWEPSNLRCSAKEMVARRSPPLAMAVSANRALVALTSSSDTGRGGKAIIVPHPRLVVAREESTPDIEMFDFPPPPVQEAISKLPPDPASVAIITSILDNHRSPLDVLHTLPLEPGPSTSPPPLSALTRALALLSDPSLPYKGAGVDWDSLLIGLSFDVRKGKGKDELEWCSMWRDIQSVFAIQRAFEMAFMRTIGGVGFELDCIWPLIGLSRWFMGFLEGLMRECLLYRSHVEWLLFNADDASNVKAPKERLEKAGSWMATNESLTSLSKLPNVHTPPTLILLLVPAYRQSILGVLTRAFALKTFLDSLTAKSDSSLTAKECLRDILGSNGVTWKSLLMELEASVFPPLEGINWTEAIISRTFPKSACGALYRGVDRLLEASVDSGGAGQLLQPPASGPGKAFPTSELDDMPDFGTIAENKDSTTTGDQFPSLRRFTAAQAENDTIDVITKGLFLPANTVIATSANPAVSTPSYKTCLRCGGMTEKGKRQGEIGRRWRSWLRLWDNRCVCGGTWWNSTAGF